MLALIGSFKFDINDTNFDKLKRNFNFNFSTQKRLGGFDHFQDVNKYDETITIDGTLIVKSQSQLLDFVNMAKQKTTQMMVFADGTAQNILIRNLETERTSFLRDGSFLRQTYKITIQIVN